MIEKSGLKGLPLATSPFPGQSPGSFAANRSEDRNEDLYNSQRITVASFNIQTGIQSSSYRDYILKSWQHLLPTGKRRQNLDKIAVLLRQFDIVGLQEVDGGGSRTGFTVQTEYLAQRAAFPHWHHQINRRFANIALHSNGLLTRYKPQHIEKHKLPGLPGRGVLLVRYGEGENALHVCVIHLALSHRARMKQIAFICDLISHLPYAIVMGDLNFEPNTPEMKALVGNTQLSDPTTEHYTFPSWKPHKILDHILVTSNLAVNNFQVLDFPCSDHLPIAMEVSLPEQIRLTIS